MYEVLHIRDKKISGKGYWISRVVVIDGKGNAVFDCYALEDSTKCPPVGVYPLVREYSPHFKRDLYELKDVPGHSEMKYHNGNTLTDTEGCPLLGANYINATVNGSVLALNKFMRVMKGVGRTTVTIVVQ